jgi:hypothetical protein
MLKRNLLCALGLVVMIVLAAGSGDTGNSFAPKPPTTERPTLKETVRQKLSLDFTWTKVGFDNIMEANFLVKNNSDYAVKDLEITCRHSAASGTEIDSNKRTIYDIVKPHSKRRFPKFNMGFIHSQARSSGFAITDFGIIAN